MHVDLASWLLKKSKQKYFSDTPSVSNRQMSSICTTFIAYTHSLSCTYKHRVSTRLVPHCGLFFEDNSRRRLLTYFSCAPLRLCLSPAADCDSAAWRTQWWATARIVGRPTTGRGACIRGERGWQNLIRCGPFPVSLNNPLLCLSCFRCCPLMWDLSHSDKEQ